MAYTTINKPSDYFNTVLYTGTGSSNAITGVGFQPDWVWIKSRTGGYSHQLFDVIRGATKIISSDATDAESTNVQKLTSFDSDGFSVGTNVGVNESSANLVSWNWLANGTGVSNTDGSITSTVSANTTSGFSIVTYTGNGSSGTIGHGLGSEPKMIFVKRYDASGNNWNVYTSSTGNSARLKLNLTDAVETGNTGPWNGTSPTSSVFSVGGAGDTNTVGGTHVAYCFAEKKGFSKFGRYAGTGNADGRFVYTGFRPAFVLVKGYQDVLNWGMYDNKRSTYNVADETLWSNSSNSESTIGTTYGMDILSNGFKARTVSSQINTNGQGYIYMAFAEHPLVSSSGVPCTAR
jgi:hypothetical protein